MPVIWCWFRETDCNSNSNNKQLETTTDKSSSVGITFVFDLRIIRIPFALVERVCVCVLYVDACGKPNTAATTKPTKKEPFNRNMQHEKNFSQESEREQKKFYILTQYGWDVRLQWDVCATVCESYPLSPLSVCAFVRSVVYYSAAGARAGSDVDIIILLRLQLWWRRIALARCCRCWWCLYKNNKLNWIKSQALKMNQPNKKNK